MAEQQPGNGAASRVCACAICTRYDGAHRDDHEEGVTDAEYQQEEEVEQGEGEEEYLSFPAPAPSAEYANEVWGIPL